LHTSHSIHSPCLSIPTAITINYTLSLHDALPLTTKGSKGAWRRPKTSSSSKYKGVSWNKKQKKWNAVMNINGGTVFLGSFYKEDDAGKAYNEAVYKFHEGEDFINEIGKDNRTP